MKTSRGEPRVAEVAVTSQGSSPASSSVKPLSAVVQEAQQVRELAAQCRDELADVNTRMREELDGPPLQIKSEGTLQKSVAVQAKVGKVSDQVATITHELTEHVRDRRLIDFQFAAAVEQEAAARHAAVHDHLTGLPNRALLEDRMRHGLAQAKRHGWGMGILFIDLDGFKHINDTLGHAIGDRVLVSVAQRLSDHSRGDDTVARFGGDEFACLMLEIKCEKDAECIAQSFLDVLSRPHESVTGDSASKPVVRASIGIALFPRHGDTAEMLLLAADAAMYRAKQNGGGYAFAE